MTTPPFESPDFQSNLTDAEPNCTHGIRKQGLSSLKNQIGWRPARQKRPDEVKSRCSYPKALRSTNDDQVRANV